MTAPQRRLHRLGSHLARILAAAAIVLVALGLPAAYVYGTTVIGQAAGNAADGNPTTFKFQTNNADVQLTRSNIAAIGRGEVSSLYGTADGMTVFDNGVNVAAPGYAGPGGPKTPLGVDLSDAAGWPDIAVGRGVLAIDPTLGRFKFAQSEPFVAGTAAAAAANAAVFDSGYLYVADGAHGLRVFRALNVASPVQTAQLATSDARDVFVSGRYAYIADGAGGLRIANLANPANPSLVASFATTDAQGVYVQGSQALVADGAGGLRIINVANPASPSLVGTLATTDARAVRGAGRYAYLADGTGGMKIVDLNTPASPSLRGAVATSDARDLAVSGRFVYVADGVGGLRIISASTLSAPVQLAQLAVAGARGVDVLAGTAYVAAGPNGLRVVDVADESAPAERGFVDTGEARHVVAAGAYAYVAAAANGVRLVALADVGATVSRVARFARDASNGHDNPTQIAVSGNYAYLADGNYGIRVLDVSNPSAPFQVGVIATNGAAEVVSVHVQGNQLYAAQKHYGAAIYDIANPATPALIYACDNAGDMTGQPCSWPRAVFGAGRYLYVADGSYGLVILDATSPISKIVGMSYYVHGSFPDAVYVLGRYAYLGSEAGMRIFDVANPATPLLVGEIAGGDTGIGFVTGINVVGNYAYVSGGNKGLQIVDVSNPAAPIRVGFNNTYRPAAVYAQAIHVSLPYAYVADQNFGLVVFDVSNPLTPTVKAMYQTADQPFGVYVAGRYAFVPNGRLYYVGLDGSEGTDIIDLAPAEAPSGPLTVRYYYDGPTDTPTRTPTNTASPTNTPTATPTPLPYEAWLNAGDGSYSSPGGAVWAADRAYGGGNAWGYINPASANAYGRVVAIAGTTDDTLYQSERWWSGDGGYRFDVANGEYLVDLRFAEIYPGAGAGQRIFDVRIEGMTVVPNLDVAARVGQATALDLRFNTTVTDNQLDIAFIKKTGNVKVNAVHIRPIGPPATATSTGTPTETLTPGPPTGTPTITNTPTITPTPSNTPSSTPYVKRVNAGGGAFSDSGGNQWLADQTYAGHDWGYVNGNVYSTSSAIDDTLDDVLYQSERWGMPSYRFNVPNGAYQVILKFAEIYPPSKAGSRIFDVKLEDVTAIAGLDIFGRVGLNRAFDSALATNVSDGVLNIDFVTRTGSPKISAIAVMQYDPGTPTPSPTASSTGTATETATAGPPTGTPTITSTPTITPTPTATLPGPAYEVRVNAGGPDYTDVYGLPWSADQQYSYGSWGYVGGKMYGTGAAIAGTSDATLYQSERYAMSAYKFDVPNGAYEVALRFAEIYWTRAGGRVFSVQIEGATVLANLDLFSVAGVNVAYNRIFTVNVSDGVLNITFSASADSPKVSAIRVTSLALAGPTATPTVTNTAGPTNSPTMTPTPSITGTATPTSQVVRRVNAGGSVYNDSQGRRWEADQKYTVGGGYGYTGDGQAYSNGHAVSGSADPTLYQSQRYNMTGYRFDVPNGNYQVTLKFAEIYPYNDVGQRVFNVNIEGVQYLTGFDILASAGRYAAIDRQYTVDVTDNALNIEFVRVASGPPLVSAIEVAANSLAPAGSPTVTYTPTRTPTNTYQDPAPTHVIQAESGQLAPYMQVGNDVTASGGQYIYDPGGPNDQGMATYHFVIPYTPWTFTNYTLWAKVWAPDYSSDSIYFSFDGAPFTLWQTGVMPGWTWARADGEYDLAQNVTHTLRLKVRENNFKVDVIDLTDRHFTDPPGW